MTEVLAHFDPETGVMVVLLLEFVDLGALQAEGTDHTDTGKVFLSHGGELALVFIAFGEAVMYLLVEVEGVKQNGGHGNQGNQH